jgi:hypothetical protein
MYINIKKKVLLTAKLYKRLAKQVVENIQPAGQQIKPGTKINSFFVSIPRRC